MSTETAIQRGGFCTSPGGVGIRQHGPGAVEQARARAVAYRFKYGERPLAGYTIQRGVGRGGFGEVYYAVSDGGREVALKYLRDNPEVELRGVAACMNFKSPNLVKIFDVKQSAEGEYFIIMEYVSGPSLRDLLLAEPKGMGPQKAAFFVRELAKGLSYLHERGVVHRDLKPGNVFYEDGYVKIGDYGLSKFISVSRHSAQTASVGTVHYMAPEVGSGNYSRGIDIYALGVILYEMLLGKVPFEGSSMGEVLMKHLTEQPEVDELPQPFGRVIRQALAKDPSDRYQTADEMVAELMGVDDIRQSVAGFDPSSLSGVVRQAVPDVGRSPAPSSNPPPPPPVPVPPYAPPPGGPAMPGQQAYPQAFRRPETPYAYAAPAGMDAAFLSPEAATGRLFYAGFWIRVLAAIIDVVVVGAASGVLMAIITGSDNNPLYPILAILYQGFLVGRWNGQTLGKKACGIKVISADGRPCGEWQAFGRALADVLNWFTLGLAYLMVAFSREKRALHDHVAGTLHVYAVR